MAAQRLEPRNPQPRRLVVLLSFFLVVAFEVLVVAARLLAVAVMRLVIEHHDVLESH